MSQYWQIISATPTTNLMTNPSFERDLTTWGGASGGSISRVVTAQSHGLWSMQVSPGANVLGGAGAGVSLPAAGFHVASAWVWGATGVPYRITLGSGQTNFVGLGRWERVSVAWLAPSAGPQPISITKNNSASTATFWVDGVQVEAGSQLSDYCDGDQPGCQWTGTLHASTSARTSASPAGVAVTLQELDTFVAAAPGAGAPPQTNHGTVYGNLDGGAYERSSVQPRVWGLQATIAAHSYEEWLGARRALIERFRVARRDGRVQLVNSRFARRRITAVYDNGLEMGEREGFSERLQLRLISHDPYWYSELERGMTLTPETSLASALVHERQADGSWAARGSGLSGGAVNVLSYGPDGRLYVGGAFTSHLRVWDGTSWTPVGQGTSGPVHALLWVGTQLYVGGNFATVGSGVSALNVAVWNGSSWAALGAGRNNIVRALAQDRSNQTIIYAGGDFTGNLASWNGSIWTTLGSLTARVRALTPAPQGVYLAGEFTPPSRVAWWNGSSMLALGSGVDSGAECLITLPDGSLLVGGGFGFAGTVLVDNLALWTGSQWLRVPSGPGNNVRALVREGAGWWLANDALLSYGNRSRAVRSGLRDTTTLTALASARDGRLAVGRDTASAVGAEALTSVTYGGSAQTAPRLVVDGAGTSTLFSLRNVTTGQLESFGLDCQNERLTIDLATMQATSSRRGDVTGLLQTAVGGWRLVPGVNRLAYLASVGAVETGLIWRERYVSLDNYE